MSKKRLRNRLDHLFSNLAEDGALPADQGAPGSEVPVDSGLGMPAEEAQLALAVQPGAQPAILPAAVPAAPQTASQLAAPAALPAYLNGWTWEIDANYNYTACGLEVSDALRMNPQGFIGKSILTYALHPQSKDALEAAFTEDKLPVDLVIYLENTPGACLPARIHILSKAEANGEVTGWRGFAQRLPDESTTQEKTPGEQKPGSAQKPRKKHVARLVEPASSFSANRQGVALEQGSFSPANQIWTDLGKKSLGKNELSLANAAGEKPATMAMPFQMQGVGDLILEIVDDAKDREWSEDDRFLVMEIAAQLALALDNAQLYISVQQELAERIRAEQATLRRNKDLATLNQIGQQLARLTTSSEIYELLASMIGEVLDNNNFYICSYNQAKDSLSFPMYKKDGEILRIPEQPLGNGIAASVIHNRAPLLITDHTAEKLVNAGIDLPQRIPTSLLAIPMIAGERVVGVIVVQDFERENAFDALHTELLSTAAAQATTALENADLFLQMQTALDAIENRERYQANVARSAAILTEFGTKSMPEVLKVLAQAARCSRVYFARIQEDERGLYWSSTADWIDSAVAYRFDKTRILHIPVGTSPNWVQNLREKGWAVTHAADETPEAEFLAAQHIRSTLLLAVPGSTSTPSYVAFDQLTSTLR